MCLVKARDLIPSTKTQRGRCSGKNNVGKEKGMENMVCAVLCCRRGEPPCLGWGTNAHR